MIYLLDGNVLVALLIDSHVHHSVVRSWFRDHPHLFATTLLTEGTLLRVHMSAAADRSAAAAWRSLASLREHPRHKFWADELAWAEVPHRNLQGAKQVTDARIAALARQNRGRVLTLDSAMQGLHHDVVDLLR